MNFYLCYQILLFYYVHDDESLHIISKGIKVSKNGKCLTLINALYGADCFNFGQITIPSQSDIICQWDIKVIKLLNDSLKIGITSSASPNKSIFSQREEHHYVFLNNSWAWSVSLSFFLPRSYQPSFKEGHLVSIHLNLKDDNGKISLVINGGDEWIGYENIKRGYDISYRLMAVLGNVDDCVEIVNFLKK